MALAPDNESLWHYSGAKTERYLCLQTEIINRKFAK